jgi:hypothetical protein
VKKAGYNVVQLMGIQEHADYSSVGYKVLIISLSTTFSTSASKKDFALQNAYYSKLLSTS